MSDCWIHSISRRELLELAAGLGWPRVAVDRRVTEGAAAWQARAWATPGDRRLAFEQLNRAESDRRRQTP